MKIAWFTPFSNKSAIGMVSKEICEELSQQAEVTIWTYSDLDLIDTTIKIQIFTKETDLSVLHKYDYLIYNMGNFAGNHRELYEVSKDYPGIIILHDQTMAGFWGQYYLFPEFGGEPETGYSSYLEMHKKYYGEIGAKTVEEAYNSGCYPIYDYDGMGDFKLIEPIIENAIGIFTHAKFFVNKIRDLNNGPIEYSYLPCKIPQITQSKGSKVSELIKQAKAEGRKIIVSSGIVHPVKRIDKVTEVLAMYPKIAKQICYIVIGSYGGEYGSKLEELSKTTLKGCLHMLGYQPNEVMNEALSQADLCINLRYPNSEVCSLSLFEQMSYRKPVLVLNSGIYGEIPEEAVIRISLENEAAGIKAALLDLISEEAYIIRTGIDAGRFIETQCTTDMYVQRLLALLCKLETKQKISQLENKVLDDIAFKLQELGYNEETVPSTINNVINSTSKMFPSNTIKTYNRAKYLGVWAGFGYHIPGLNREGIARFMSYMVEALVRNYGINVEVWCYSFNMNEMKICFSSILEDEGTKNRIQFIDENNWKEIFTPTAYEVESLGEINEVKDNLATIAREFSKADVFTPLIVYLDNVIGTEKSIYVPCHDMAVAEHYDEFLEKDKNFKFRYLDIGSRAENLARYGAIMFSNCKTVRDEQILKYIKNLKHQNTNVIYLPVNIPKDIMNKLMEEKELRQKFSIHGRYMFYPTQIRPYKNIGTLIKAFNILKEDFKDLKLVLTGNPKDMPEVDQLIDKFNLRSRIVLLKNLSEVELYSVYKYAEVVPVPTLFEGGFAWQACEALFMKVPLVVSNIKMTVERIESCGFNEKNCGLRLFNAINEKELANSIQYVLKNREIALKSQEKFAEVFLGYSWDDAAKEYYDMFFGHRKGREVDT